MTNFGKVHRITREIGGKVCTFRSKLEARWAHWCQVRKEQGFIVDWWYEDPDSLIELALPYKRNKKLYLPDFTILTADGDYGRLCFEFEETKGYFPPSAYTKLSRAAEQYDNPITLIFAKKPYKAQLARAQRLEPHIKRIIWNADETIFAKINYLFDF